MVMKKEMMIKKTTKRKMPKRILRKKLKKRHSMMVTLI